MRAADLASVPPDLARWIVRRRTRAGTAARPHAASAGVSSSGGLVEVSKAPQRVAAACTWLLLGLAVVGVLISGRDAIGSVTVNAAALLAGLGVAAVGAAIITAVSLTELDSPLLHPNGLVVDLGRLVYLGGVTGALVAGHGVATPLWVLYLPVLLATAFIDVQWKAI